MVQPISDKSCGIYGITHIASGRRYIGKTRVTFLSRWNHHRGDLKNGKHHNSHLQRAWNKYGEDAFEFGPLESLDHVPEAELNAVLTERECLWLLMTPDAYNQTIAGPEGMKATPETLAKLSADRIRRWADPTFRDRTLAAIRAGQATEEYKLRHAANVSAGMQNPEYHALRSAITAQQWKSGPLREAQRAGMVAMWQNPEKREYQIAKRKANWADPERRAKHSAAIQAAWDADPEHKVRRTAAMRAGQSYPIFDAVMVAIRGAHPDWITPQQARVVASEMLGEMPSTQAVFQTLKRLVTRGEAEKNGPRYRLKTQGE